MKSYVAKPAEVVRQWHLVDATDKTVGRLAAQIARILMGKHRPTYTPHVVGKFPSRAIVVAAAGPRHAEQERAVLLFNDPL